MSGTGAASCAHSTVSTRVLTHNGMPHLHRHAMSPPSATADLICGQGMCYTEAGALGARCDSVVLQSPCLSTGCRCMCCHRLCRLERPWRRPHCSVLWQMHRCRRLRAACWRSRCSCRGAAHNVARATAHCAWLHSCTPNTAPGQLYSPAPLLAKPYEWRRRGIRQHSCPGACRLITSRGCPSPQEILLV